MYLTKTLLQHTLLCNIDGCRSFTDTTMRLNRFILDRLSSILSESVFFLNLITKNYAITSYSVSQIGAVKLRSM